MCRERRRMWLNRRGRRLYNRGMKTHYSLRNLDRTMIGRFVLLFLALLPVGCETRNPVTEAPFDSNRQSDVTELDRERDLLMSEEAEWAELDRAYEAAMAEPFVVTPSPPRLPTFRSGVYIFSDDGRYVQVVDNPVRRVVICRECCPTEGDLIEGCTCACESCGPAEYKSSGTDVYKIRGEGHWPVIDPSYWKSFERRLSPDFIE